MTRAVRALALCLVFLFSTPAAAEQVILLLGAREAEEERVRLIVEAQREINDAYFIVGDDAFSLTGLSLLCAAARRATTDNLLPQAGYVGHKKNLVRSSVELWEYGGPECLHSKVAVIDDRVLIVGSFNLDPRSERLNTELAAVARAPFLVASMLDSMEAHLARALAAHRSRRQAGRLVPSLSRSVALEGPEAAPAAARRSLAQEAALAGATAPARLPSLRGALAAKAGPR